MDDGSGKYKISKHYLRLFDGENGDNPDEAGSLPVDASDVLINFVNNAFADLGTTAIDYLNGKIITKLAQEIIDKARNEEFRLIYDEK